MSAGTSTTAHTPTAPAALGRALLDEAPGVALGPGDVLHIYNRSTGSYIEGEDALARMAQRLLGNSASTHRVTEALSWLRRHDGVPSLWEKPPDNVLLLRNGLLHLSPAKQLRDHTPEHLTTVRLGAAFDPMARCPNIERFLARVLPEDAHPVFYELIGYLLTPDTGLKMAALFLGPGDSGKSTALMVLERLLGEGNVSHCSLHDLCEHRFSLAQLVGRLANFFADLDHRILKHPSVFKILTGQDALEMERKYGQPFKYRPFARHIYSANQAPPTSDRSTAFFNRWLVVPFPYSVPREEQDRRLLDKLTTPDELSGLLNLALEGLDRLRRQGDFTRSPTLRKAARDYRRDADPVAAFLDTVLAANPQGAVRKQDLYDKWQEHAAQSKLPAMSRRAFYAAAWELLKRRVTEGSDTNGWPVWRGVVWNRR